MTGYLLGIDVGTTSTKAALIDTDGHLLAEAARPAMLSTLRPGWAEADPEKWWRNVCGLIPECLARANVKASQIAAVAASGLVPVIILVNRDGQPVRPSIQQNDTRAVTEIEEQRQHTDARDILRRTGSVITQQSVGPKLLWLRRQEPESMQQAVNVMGSYDFITYQLSGALSIERNWALESGLFDLQQQAWDDNLLRLATLDRAWLAPVRSPGEVVGQVTAQAASACGLRAGTPVVVGSADHVASAFSAGLRQPGDLLVKLGGSGDILCCVDQIETDARLYLDYHILPGQFLLNGCMATSGSLIRWFQSQFAPTSDYATLDTEAASLPAGADGLVLLPYFLGEKTPLHDPFARGTLVGLTLTHTRAHVFRAILEGIAYGFYHHLEIIREHGYTPTRARVTNGGARSLLWKQITADVLGLRLEGVARHPGSSLGAAFVAGMGVGAFCEWVEIERFIQVAAVVEPNAENHERYQSRFKLYRKIYDVLKETYPLLA